MQYVDKGLGYHPQSEELLLRAYPWFYGNSCTLSAEYANKVLANNPGNAAARSLLNGIKDQVRKKQAGP